MKIWDLFSKGELAQMQAGKYVRVQDHPTEPLRIYNYTEGAQFEQVWNEVTLNCRGLIADLDDNIVARPFAKFFNHDHKVTPAMDLNSPVVVMDKADGSLGILYKVPSGGYAIATRGSFASDQAIHATKLLNEKYGDWLKKASERIGLYTPLFEIVYPQNRIVLDYGDMDDLILLGMVDILTGVSWTPHITKEFLGWPGPVVQEFEYGTYGEALAAPMRENAEGFVVHFPEENMHIKIKQSDYIELHRIVTGLNERTVWRHILDGKPMSELIEKLPDEFHQWVQDIYEGLREKFDNIMDNLDAEYQHVMDESLAAIKGTDIKFPSREFRKVFAEFAKETGNAGYLFMILDGKPVFEKIWDSLRPEGNMTPAGREINEDNT